MTPTWIAPVATVLLLTTRAAAPGFAAPPATVPARTWDVTFKVPVKLSSLHPSIVEVRVGCFINPDTQGQRGEWVSLGAPVNGAVDQVVTVIVRYPDDLEAKAWRCKFALRDSAGNSPLNPSYTTTLIAFKAKPGTKLVWQSEGSFGASLSGPALKQTLPTK